MILHIYTIIHTLISLVGIFTGFVVLFGLLAGKRLDGWTKWFLITTVATSVTGFFFPFHGFTPAHGVGIISLVVTGGGDLRTLPASTRRALALDLRRHGSDCSLSQCLCRCCAGFPESAGPESAGSDADRAAI